MNIIIFQLRDSFSLILISYLKEYVFTKEIGHMIPLFIFSTTARSFKAALLTVHT